MGFLHFLTLLFVGLKLAEIGIVAEWSWWLVTSPIWGGFIIIFVYSFLKSLK